MLMEQMEMYSICDPACFKTPMQFATFGETLNFQEFFILDSSLILLHLAMKTCKQANKQTKPSTVFLFSFSVFNASFTYQLAKTEFTPSQYPSGSSTGVLQTVSPLLLLGLFGPFLPIVNNSYYS